MFFSRTEDEMTLYLECKQVLLVEFVGPVNSKYYPVTGSSGIPAHGAKYRDTIILFVFLFLKKLINIKHDINFINCTQLSVYLEGSYLKVSICSLLNTEYSTPEEGQLVAELPLLKMSERNMEIDESTWRIEDEIMVHVLCPLPMELQKLCLMCGD
jgi:hypothetical protein